MDVILKVISTVDSKLASLEQKDGQLIFCKDTQKILLDLNGVRTAYEQIITINTDSQRTEILAPVDGFYFVLDTHILWRYSAEWIQITSQPADVVKINQGSSNSGKFLGIGPDGNVSPMDAPSGGTVDTEQIQQAVDAYLEENPVQPGATVEQATQIEQNKQDIGSLSEDIGNKLDKYKYSANKANPSLFVDGTLNASTGAVYSTVPFATSDYIRVDNHSKAFIGCFFKNVALTYTSHRYCFYDSNKVFITGNDASDYLIEIPNTAKYIRFSIANNQYLQSTMFAFSDSITDFIPYSATEIIVPQKYKDLLPYKGKTVLFYGDSFTEFGNTDPYAGYQGFVKDNLGIGVVISRGIGGQRILWNNTTFYANSDGSFNSRNDDTPFSKDPPIGTTEHYGSFCSWDRITTMIPDSIKNTIDYIVIFGGTNDFGAWGEPIGETYTWVSNDNTDKAWAASSEYSKFNGDFDISETFKGAVASMIVKMQTWCPDAKLVVCTPCGGRTNVKGGVLTEEPTNNINKTLRDYANAMIEVCERFGVYYVDVNADSGINIFNSKKYNNDGKQTKKKKKKKIANCISNGMYNY